MLNTFFYEPTTEEAIGFYTENGLACGWCAEDCFSAGKAMEESYADGLPDGYTCAGCGVTFLPVGYEWKEQ